MPRYRRLVATFVRPQFQKYSPALNVLFHHIRMFFFVKRSTVKLSANEILLVGVSVGFLPAWVFLDWNVVTITCRSCCSSVRYLLEIN